MLDIDRMSTRDAVTRRLADRFLRRRGRHTVVPGADVLATRWGALREEESGRTR